MSDETVLQFGGGNFLRGFVDAFVHDANATGQNVGRIVVVQSTRSGIADTINRQQGVYHVVTRGLRNGRAVDEVSRIESLSRAFDAQSDWAQVIDIATSQSLNFIVSNTTEAGFALDPADTDRSSVPASFPAKLLAVLWARFQAGLRQPIQSLPCELLPKNGDRLRTLVLEQASRWGAPANVVAWLRDGCVWHNSLVDRIVSGKPAEHPLLASDALLTVAEPFALWAIEKQPRARLFEHPAIHWVDDTAPIELRKVRVLNGAHTALVCKALPMGIATVREAVNDPEVGAWLRRLLDEEILPTLETRTPGLRAFADSALERFANPFVEHKLSAIALNHEAKLRTRLIPTRDEYVVRFGKRPRLLDELLSE